MKGIFPRLLLVVAFLVGTQLSVVADAAATVEKFRASFEKRMNSELDEHGKAARDLRIKYLDALKKLKLELGRNENLKGAAQVVAEIEAVEDGEEAKELPADADHKFKRVRDQWERGLVEIRNARKKKLETTANLYFKALDTEKRRLTRAGKIKDALLFEEEEKRVRALPEVAAVLSSNGPDGAPAVEVGEDLALASKGARAAAPNRPQLLIDGNTKSTERMGFAWGNLPARLEVDLGQVRDLVRIRFLLFDLDKRKYGYKLSVSKDGRSWDLLQSERRAQSWQEINLDKVEVRYIRIEGTDNSANEQFHVVEVEAYEAR